MAIDSSLRHKPMFRPANSARCLRRWGLAASLVTALLGASVDRAASATYSWATATSGTWSNPANWLPNSAYPTAGADAEITAPGSAYTITLDNPISLTKLNLGVTSATLNITATGSLSLPASSTAAFNGPVTNNGVMTLATPTSFSSSLTNNASLTLSANTSFDGIVTNNTSLDVPAGVQLSTSIFGSFNQTTGTLGGAGTFTSHGAFVLSGGTLQATNASGNFFRAVNGSFTYNGGTITGELATSSTDLYFASTPLNAATLSALDVWDTLYTNLPAPITLHLIASSTGNARLLLAGATTSAGQINLDSTSSTATCELNTNGATLLNSGTITTLPGSGGIRELTGSFNNTGTITLNASTMLVGTLNNTGTVSVQAGTFSLAGSLTQLPAAALLGGTWYVAANATLDFGVLPAIATNQATITLDGPGSSFPAVNSLIANQGIFTVTNGRNFTAAGPFVNSGTLAAGPNSTVTLPGLLTAAGGTLTGNIHANAGLAVTAKTRHTGPGTLVIAGGPLIVSPGMALDLTNTSMIFESSADSTTADFASLSILIAAGRNAVSGPWTGPGLTTSSATPSTGLALVRNSQLPLPFNSSTRLFAGQPVDANSLLIKYTYNGDLDLDGSVTLRDYQLLDYSYLNNGVGINGATGWLAGDINYDGAVNYADFALADAAFAAHGPALADSVIALHLSEFGPQYAAALAAAIPEPATFPLVACAMAAVLLRPRRTRA